MNVDGRLQINSADQNVAGFNMSNRSFKLALMSNQTKLAVANPFDIDGTGAKAVGYVDLLGAINAAAEGDEIDASETAPARISKQRSARRGTLADTDNNTIDFSPVDYRTADMTIPQPRTSDEGEWDPITGEAGEPKEPGEPNEPGEPGETTATLLIFQIGAATDGNISHSFVELYNNGETAVNLSGYSLQYAEGTRETVVANQPNTATTDGAWSKINLSGSIPPRHSFLILGDEGIGQTATTNPALSLTAGSGDMNSSFVISNRSFKVVLLQNTTLLTVQNPFDIDGLGEKASGYVDMVGAMNTVGEDKINGYEKNAITNLNKQTGQRRISLSDTDDNNVDFARATYLNASVADKERLRPKNLAYGAWNPVTGQQEQDPEYPLTITFNSEADFAGITAHYSLSGTEGLDITLTNHAKYSAVYYILNENAPVQVSSGNITITATNLKKSNYLLIVVTLDGLEYSKPIEITKN
jgi:hypothetical protein